jgi:uncharacterized protein (DUF362 family)/Pyruvate/2-oxoacid:ferredoxin oxidoreductase delta subunit
MSTTTSVSLISCAGYDREVVHAAVQQAVDLLGGMSAFVRPGQRVLLKPNLLKARPPEAAVTTHPEVVRAVVRLVQQAGGRVEVGDSPGMGDLAKVSERTGILGVVREEGAELADFSEAVGVKNAGRFQRFEIARPAREADVIINLPKLKTHGMTTLTGAVKNLFGCVPGKRKVQWHFNTGVNHELFMDMLVELSMLLRPQLTIMDAVVGMEGNGPGSGDPRRIGVVIAGADPVAVDAVAARVVGVDPEKLAILRSARAKGIGEMRQAFIEVLGDPIGKVAITGFRLPPQEHLEWRLPEWARRSLKEALTTRPVIDHARCIQCGICSSHCPQQAISTKGKKLEIRYRDCIRCFCCQEFCPQGAIAVGKGWLLRLVPRS